MINTMIINFYKSLHSDSQRLFNTGQYIVDQIEVNAQNSNTALNSSDNSEFPKSGFRTLRILSRLQEVHSIPT